MSINETNRPGTGRLDPTLLRTATAPLQPAASPQQTAAAPQPAAAPEGGVIPDGANLTGATDRLAGAGAMSYDPVPWKRVVSAAKDGIDDLREAVSGMSYAQTVSAAGQVAGLAKGIGDVADGYSEFAEGDYVGGGTGMVRGAADIGASGLKLADTVMGTKRFSGASADLKSVGSFARGVDGTVQGFNEIRDGEYLAGGAHLAGGLANMGSGAASIAAGRTLAQATQTGRAMGLTGDALESFKRDQLGGSLGRFAAPLAVGATAINGAFDVAGGIGQIREGNVLDGSLQIGQGLIDTAASASHIASILPTVSSAIQTFGRAAGPLGAAAGVVGGGMQVYESLNGNPPDYRGAAVGGAKAAGSALLLTPPPGNVAGATILIGAALYENVTPVREVVDGAVGGVIEAGEGIINGASEVAEGVSEAADELAEGARDVGRELAEGDLVGAAGEAAESVVAAATDVGRGVVEGAEALADGVSNGIRRIDEGLDKAGESIASGFNSAKESVGRFMSSLF